MSVSLEGSRYNLSPDALNIIYAFWYDIKNKELLKLCKATVNVEADPTWETRADGHYVNKLVYRVGTDDGLESRWDYDLRRMWVKMGICPSCANVGPAGGLCRPCNRLDVYGRKKEEGNRYRVVKIEWRSPYNMMDILYRMLNPEKIADLTRGRAKTYWNHRLRDVLNGPEMNEVHFEDRREFLHAFLKISKYGYGTGNWSDLVRVFCEEGVEPNPTEPGHPERVLNREIAQAIAANHRERRVRTGLQVWNDNSELLRQAVENGFELAPSGREIIRVRDPETEDERDEPNDPPGGDPNIT